MRNPHLHVHDAKGAVAGAYYLTELWIPSLPRLLPIAYGPSLEVYLSILSGMRMAVAEGFIGGLLPPKAQLVFGNTRR